MFQISTHLWVIRFQEIICIYVKVCQGFLSCLINTVYKPDAWKSCIYLHSLILPSILLKHRSLEKTCILFLLKKVLVLLSLPPIFVILHKTSQVERVTKRKGTIPLRKCFNEVEKGINVSGCLAWNMGSHMKKKYKELESIVRYSVSCQKMAAT